MFDWQSPAEWKRVWRYYQAGVVNALFGYGLFALLVSLHVNLYAAQILSHLVGMAFNYFTYTRHAFKNRESSKLSFIISYALNYLIGLLFLWIGTLITPSPYLTGLFSIVLTSIVNYFILNLIVFRRGYVKNGPA